MNLYKVALLPRAKKALEEIQYGFSKGRYKILDVIESQNTLVEIEINYIEMQREFYNSIYDLEYLVASSIKNIK